MLVADQGDWLKARVRVEMLGGVQKELLLPWCGREKCGIPPQRILKIPSPEGVMWLWSRRRRRCLAILAACSARSGQSRRAWAGCKILAAEILFLESVLCCREPVSLLLFERVCPEWGGFLPATHTEDAVVMEKHIVVGQHT